MPPSADGSPVQSEPPSFTPLATHDFPTSVAGGQQAAASTASSRSHHLLPASISPTADLALVFTTTAPPPVAPATSAAGPAAAALNQSGLSAAQKLIQQRMAAMRARAAAAAGLPSGSSAGDVASGPVKGQPVEMSLWRIGAEMELVWKQQIKMPDALFEDGEERVGISAKEREQETLTVGGMQWSPNGRQIALQITVSRSTSSESFKRSITVANLYTVQDGLLASVSPLPGASPRPSARGHKQMLWVNLNGATSLDRGETPGASRYALKKYPGRSPVDLSPIIALAAASPGSGSASGSGGGGRFHALMGGGGGTKAEIILPSQRGLESEHASKGGDGEKEDLLRCWSSLAGTSGSEMDLLLVAGQDLNDRSGVWLLLRGKVPIAFLQMPEAGQGQGRLLSCFLDSQREVHTAVLELSEGDAAERQLHLRICRTSTPFLARPSGLTSLLHLMDVSSRLRTLSAQALDLSFLVSAVFKTLEAVAPIPNGSLSAQQATMLPPISRLQYAMEQLAISHVQSMRNHLITLLCTGVASEMIESLLLNTLVSGKWKGIYEETLKAYEAIEVAASELGRVAEEMGGCVTELEGWSDWTERSRPFLPDLVNDLPLSSHLHAQQNSISILRSSAHKIVHYAQGERLAWDELNKWVGWERERVEALNTELDEQPYTARTFDPLVIIEFVQRDFECPELRWLLLSEKSKVQRDSEAEGKGDDTEESFVKANGTQNPPALGDKTDTEAILKQLDGEDRGAFAMDERSKADSKQRLKKTLRWLQDERLGHDTTPDLQAHSSSHIASDEPPRLFQAEIVPPHGDSMYTDVPLAPRLRHIVKALRAVFEGLLERLSDLETVTETVSLPLRQGWGGLSNIGTSGRDVIASLPAGYHQHGKGAMSGPAAEAEQPESLLASVAHLARSIVYVDVTTGETVHQVVVGISDRRSLLCVRVPRPTGNGLGSVVEVSLDFESFELLGHDRLLVVTKDRTSALSTPSALECVDLDALFEGSAQTIDEYVSQVDLTSSGTMPDSVVLLRRALSTDDSAVADDADKEEDNVKRQLAVSSGRNIAAILTRSRQAGTAAGAGEQQQQQPAWTRQVVEFWDVVAAEEDEEGEDDGMAE